MYDDGVFVETKKSKEDESCLEVMIKPASKRTTTEQLERAAEEFKMMTGFYPVDFNYEWNPEERKEPYVMFRIPGKEIEVAETRSTIGKAIDVLTQRQLSPL